VNSPHPPLQVPATSAFEPLRRRSPEEPDVRRLVALNKADLADPSETEVIELQPRALHMGEF
jgi:hypothetical protein